MSKEIRADAPVVKVGAELKPGDPSIWEPQSYLEWRNRERVRTVLAEWSEQEREERKLRTRVAGWVFSLVGIQVVLVFVILFLQSTGEVDIDKDVARVFFPSIFIEIVGLAFVVVKYLFSANKSGDSRDMIKGLEDGD